MRDWLLDRTQISAGKTALVCDDQYWTYAELNENVTQLAHQLAAAGVKPGENVAVLMPNSPEFVFLIHALARLRAVLVPLNIRLGHQELAWQVTRSRSTCIICSDQTSTKAGKLPARRVNIQALPGSTSTVASPPLPALDLDAMQAIQAIIYTSGTTGHPKGTMLTYGNHFYGAVASAFRLGTEPAARWLVSLPLYHVGGMAVIWRSCLYGTTAVLLRDFSSENIIRALNNHHVSLMSVVPTMLHRLVTDHISKMKTPYLRCILVGGSALPAPLAQKCVECELPVAATYGLTEAASQVATAIPADVVRKPGSVGQPLMFTTIRIVNAAGQTLPAGEIGEIVVRGPTVMAGYYDEPDATRQALRNGELYTGDMGFMDEAGDLWLVDRRADLIVTGGENVYPAEVENTLRHHPAVVDVCVVGVPDPEWGQRVAAAVALQPQATVDPVDLMDFARSYLAGYKVPRLIKFVSTLPQTASGKVRRVQVRQKFLEDG